MPRKPLGKYVRGTADWFQHNRGRAQAIVSNINSLQVAIGLFNGQQPGTVCHILGVSILIQQTPDDPIPVPISGRYYGGQLPPLDPSVVVYIPPTEAFFDLDPITMVVAQAGGGFGDVLTQSNALLIPVDNVFFTPAGENVNDYFGAKIWYPPGGIAAMKGGRGYALYIAPTTRTTFQVMFDFVMLGD